jgi:hypothetical protein
VREEGKQEMQVILDVFSGRPNPSWELTSQEASELARRLIGLVPANRTLTEGGLGYRGLIVANPDKVASLPVQVRVFHGIIGLWNKRHLWDMSLTQWYKGLGDPTTWPLIRKEIFCSATSSMAPSTESPRTAR